jgi:DNA-binding transcriptional ArsR family regulator
MIFEESHSSGESIDNMSCNIEKKIWQVAYIPRQSSGQETFKGKQITINPNWDELKVHFERIHESAKKETVPMFGVCRFIPDAAKTLENIIDIQIFAVDIDGGISFDELIEIVKEYGFQAIIYTSHNHKREAPRFRVVLFLSRSINKVEFDSVWHSLNYIFKGAICTGTKNANKMYHFPSRPPDSDEGHFVEFHEGGYLDPDTLPKPSGLNSVIEGQERALNAHCEALDVEEGVFVSGDEIKVTIERFLKEHEDKGSSNSEVQFSVLLSCSSGSIKFQCVSKAFDADKRMTHHHNKIKQMGLERARRELKRDYERAYIKSECWGFEKGLGEFKRRIWRLREHIARDNQNWQGIAGNNRRKVLQASLTHFEKCCKEEITLSERQIAETIEGIEGRTIRRHMDSLIRDGYLIKVKKKRNWNEGVSYRLGNKLTELATYRLTINDSIELNELETNKDIVYPYVANQGENNLTGISSLMVPGQTDTYGIFTSQLIGKSSEPIWIALQSGPKTIIQLIEITGKSRNVVRRAIKRMDEYSIITFKHGIAEINPDYDLFELADNLGTLHRRQETIERHRAERFRHREKTIRWVETQRYQPAEEEIEYYWEQSRLREEQMSDFAIHTDVIPDLYGE